MMNTPNITFLQSLIIEDCELWQMKENYTSCRACGPLQVLYSHKLDLFILKLNEFSWALEKNLQIIGTFSEKENWHSYMIPNPSGFFMIKVISPDSEDLIKNFETILSNTVHFLKKGGLEQRLGSYQQHEEKHSGFFDKAINAISETFKPFIPKHKETHANQLIPRTFEQLKDLDSHSVPVIDIPEYKIYNLREEMGEISRSHQETSHWKEIRDGHLSPKEELKVINLDPDQHIAGTGLTSQSFGTGINQEIKRGEEENLEAEPKKLSTQRKGSIHSDAREHCKVEKTECLSGQDQQHFTGAENQRLPSYEIEQTKDELEQGFEQAHSNLQCEQVPSLTYLEEDAFTSGLLAKKAKVDDSRDYPLNQDSDFIHKPFSYQLVDHDSLSLPKIPPSGDHGHFGAQHSKRRIEEREKENEKKNLETIQEKSEAKENHPIKESTGGIKESNIDPLNAQQALSEKASTKKKMPAQELDKENVEKTIS